MNYFIYTSHHCINNVWKQLYRVETLLFLQLVLAFFSNLLYFVVSLNNASRRTV